MAFYSRSNPQSPKDLRFSTEFPTAECWLANQLSSAVRGSVPYGHGFHCHRQRPEVSLQPLQLPQQLLLTISPQCKSMTTAWGCPPLISSINTSQPLSWVYLAPLSAPSAAFMCRSFGILIKLGGNFIFIIINSTAKRASRSRSRTQSRFQLGSFYQIKLISGASSPR